MKKAFLFVFFASISVYATAQKCKLDLDKIDPFTNEHLKSGTNGIGGMGWNWKFTLNKQGDNYGWEMQIKWGIHLEDPLKKGDTIYCKLENGKIIKLICNNDFTPSHTGAPGGFITTIYRPQGNLDLASMNLFSESPITTMRVNVSGQKLEPKISSNQGKSIQAIAKCLISE